MWGLKRKKHLSSNKVAPFSGTFNQKPPSIGFVVMAFLFTIAIDAVFAFFMWQDFASYSFHETKGKIVSGEVEKRTQKPRKSRSLRYTPRIDYQYQVDGKTFSSSGIRFSDTSYNNRLRAEQVLAKHPVGSDVIVYFDPSHPKRSVLLRGFSTQSIFFALTIFPIINLGFLLLLCFRVFPDKMRGCFSFIWSRIWHARRSGPWNDKLFASLICANENRRCWADSARLCAL